MNIEKVNVSLNRQEKNEFEFHLNKIIESIEERNRATSNVIIHVGEIISKELWREKYKSSYDFIQDVLQLEESSYNRFAKANRMYLYLIQQTKDKDEQTTLSLMKEGAYRELRRISTDSVKPLRKGDESTDSYKQRMKIQEEEDFQLVYELWSKIYPHIRSAKIDNNKILPNGGCYITDTDIMIASKVLQKAIEAVQSISDGKSMSEVSIGTLEGRDISIAEVIETSGEHSSEVIDAIVKLGVSEQLTEKLRRQRQHIQDKLENVYTWDKYEGVVKIKNGRLILENPMSEIDLMSEFSDLIKNNIKTMISVRRPNRVI